MYQATARTATAECTAQADTPERAAMQLAELVTISTENYTRLLRRGFVHVGYRDDSKEMFYAVDAVLE